MNQLFQNMDTESSLQLRICNICQKKSSGLDLVSKIKGSLPFDVVNVNIPKDLLPEVVQVLHDVLNRTLRSMYVVPLTVQIRNQISKPRPGHNLDTFTYPSQC